MSTKAADSERHDFIRGRNNACTICNRAESAPAHYKPAVLSINLDDRGQTFAGVATIRAAIFDVMDGFNPLIMDRNLIPDRVKSEDRENFERSTFVDAVIARIAELQQPPHDGIKLENLCPRHKVETLPRPTVSYCPQCRTEYPKRERITR